MAIDLERDPAWIFQRNAGSESRPIEVSVALYEGRAYRRYCWAAGETGTPWYSTANRLDAPESEWTACHRNGALMVGLT
jgi:hypothetical protein